MPIRSLAILATNLEAKRRQGGQWLNTDDLQQMYFHCGIPSPHWGLLTTLLEKLAIVTAASQ